ncbi:hypothetical protein B7494_g3319 [Chlorociboria aeruginascens]|nr:hypothetical protein B7494_g3319 [Chlorociboria aeruginascens]
MFVIKTTKIATTSSKFAQLDNRAIKTLSKDPNINRYCYLAEKGAKQYVLKPLQEQMFAQAKRTTELQDCHFVRVFIDMNKGEWTVMYEYMTSTLLHLATGRECVIEKAIVGDDDNAVFLGAGHAIACQVGNVWWRSPEAQLGVSVEASTDIFSLALCHSVKPSSGGLRIADLGELSSSVPPNVRGSGSRKASIFSCREVEGIGVEVMILPYLGEMPSQFDTKTRKQTASPWDNAFPGGKQAPSPTSAQSRLGFAISESKMTMLVNCGLRYRRILVVADCLSSKKSDGENDVWENLSAKSKAKATIRNEGDIIGWEDDEEVVGPMAFAAKQSLLRAIPHIMPLESSQVSLYRLVLNHGDFGIHNTSVTKDTNGEPLITSLYYWETGYIVPALLSDPLVAAGPVDLIMDEDGRPSFTRLPKNPTPNDLGTYVTWAQHYITVKFLQKLYKEAPGYEIAIGAGKDVRYLWFALRDWHGGNSEEFFAGLGTWAEKRIRNSALPLRLNSLNLFFGVSDMNLVYYVRQVFVLLQAAPVLLSLIALASPASLSW